MEKPRSVITLKEFFPKELLSGELVESVHMMTYDDSHSEDQSVEEKEKVDSNAPCVNFGETSATTSKSITAELLEELSSLFSVNDDLKLTKNLKEKFIQVL